MHGGLLNVINTPVIQEHISNQIKAKSPQIPLAVVMIFQNDADYLKEWIEFHKMLGVERFYLYNNNSKDNYKQVLNPYIKSGLVHLIQWDNTGYDGQNIASWNAVQCLAYVNALQKARDDNVKWLAIIDSDEFLVPNQTDSLIEFLAQYENEVIGSLIANWVMFGTSYVEKIPPNKLMIETLLLNNGYHLCGGKSIVRPERCDSSLMGGPHEQPMLPNYVSLSIPFDVLQCNHYWSRDEYYLNNVKIPRRILWGTSAETCLEWATHYNEHTSASSPILRFIPQLRKNIGLD